MTEHVRSAPCGVRGGKNDFGRDGARASDAPRWDEMVLVGHVARVHGLRGEVVVNPETDFVEERFQAGKVVYVERAGDVQPLVIRSMRVQRGRAVVRFDGVDAIEEAERLGGLDVKVPASWLRSLPDRTYYVHDLVGCRVETDAGTIGTVAGVEGDGGASRLAVTTPQGEVLVPLAADICRAVDVERKVIVIAPPDGLLELNRPTGLPRRKDRRAEASARRRQAAASRKMRG